MELANPTFESRIYTIVLFDKETLQSTLSVYLPLTPKEETADKFEPFYEVDKGNLSKGYLRNFWPKPRNDVAPPTSRRRSSRAVRERHSGRRACDGPENALRYQCVSAGQVSEALTLCC